MTCACRLSAACCLLVALLGLVSPGHAAEPGQLEFFEKEIRPVLATHCYECHSVKSRSLKAGLRLDSRAAVLKGGESGPAYDASKPGDSLLLAAVRYDGYEMPPRGKLPAAQIAALEKWVAMGLPWPDEPEPEASRSPPPFDLAARKQSHWCWQPIQSPPLPDVHDAAWPRADLDRFILAKLEERGLKPAPSVDRRTLIRRLSFDLIGLPPTPEEIASFVNDPAPNAVEKVVDRLLDSPHFGERWGRHWLDLVRFAESRGHEFDNDTPNAWQYRDYVIRAWNADVPYDQFVREHIAGDVLDPPRLNPEKGFNESILGTGFWHLGEWVHSPVDIRRDETDRFDNMLDVMSKTFLGVTVACARCHDHKFDAISQRDYSALSGFLQGSDYRQAPFEALEHNRALARKLATIDAEANQRIRELTTQFCLKNWSQVARESNQAREPRNDDPGELPHGVTYVVDYRAKAATEFIQDGFVYGRHAARPGDIVPSDSEKGFRIDLVEVGYARSDPLWTETHFPVDKSSNQKGRLESLPRSGRTLRTPSFEIRSGNIVCRVRGRGTIVACVDSHRLVAGPLHGETIVDVSPRDGQSSGSAWRWAPLNLRRYAGHRVHLEFTPAVGATLDVQLVCDGAEAPQESVSGMEVLDDDKVARLLTDWNTGKPLRPAQVRFLALAVEAVAKSPETSREFEQLLSRWAQERSNVKASISRAESLAPAMLDGSGEDDRLLIRGNSSTPGDVVPRRFLEAIDGDRPLEIARGSGRLELAQRITDPRNPLTTRVIVNRLWQHLMGRGIVPTVDDFGVLGQRPSHPELLDYLATQFMADGQSVKTMIRRIALSQTYRMSGDASPASVQADPRNELWHHVAPRRLEGEVLRDTLLAVSGRLDRTQFGPSVKVHLTGFMDGRGRPPKSGPEDGAGRRSIYLEVRRNFLSPFMLTFDTPNPFSTMGRRNVSNVPAQALILMNDPFVRSCAESWAKRAIRERPAGGEDRIRWMFDSGLGRAPTNRELELIGRFVGLGPAVEEQAAWTEAAHALFNTKEFVFVK